MFDSTVLNVVIGLVLIFLLYSLLATAMQEAIANMLQRRANMLQYGIKCMLTKTVNNSNKSKIGLIIYYSKKTLLSWWRELKSFFVKKDMRKLHEQFYNHPIIKNYGQNSLFSKPSYIGARNFSTILVDTLKNLDPANVSKAATFEMLEKVLAGFEENPNDNSTLVYRPETQNADGTKTKAAIDDDTPVMDKETDRILTFHMKEAAGDLDVLRSRLEQWFNDTMDRVTGWYKKNTHYWLFGIGLFLAVTLNIDTIAISNYLSKNKAAAEQLAKLGQAAVESGNSTFKGQDSVIAKTALDTIKKNIQQVNTLVGLGWGTYGRTDTPFLKSINDKKWCTPNGSWYTLWLPFKTVSVADTFALTVSAVQDLDNSGAHRLDSIAAVIKTDWTNLSKKQKADSIKLNQDSAAYYGQLNTWRYQRDSLRFLVGYDKLAQACGVRLKTVYIRSQTDWAKFFGFFITAIAVGLGAPFWYDLLNKFVNIKSAGKQTDGGTTQGKSTDNSDQTEG